MGVTINQLSEATSLSSGDKIPIYSNAQGDARKASLAALLGFIEANFASPEFTTIINAPTLSGFNLALTAQTSNVWLILNPTGSFAAGTVTLPAPADCFDGQEIILCTTQNITAFTLNGNGSTLVGQPTSLGAGAFFTIRYNALQTTWYCTSQNNVSTFTTVTLTGGINDSNGNELLKVSPTAAAVNEVTIANAATGGKPTITVSGNDADISLNLTPKGAGSVQVSGVPIANTTGVQTLTNKTLTSPTINGGLLSAVSLSAPTANTILLDVAAKFVGLTVATLPVPATTGPALGIVTDSTVAINIGIGNPVVGGGANIVPVYCDGVFWRIG